MVYSFFLESNRLLFSTWDENKIDDALQLWSHPEVTHYITRGGMSERDITTRLNQEIDNQKRNHYQYWPLYLKSTGTFIGCCGLRPLDQDVEIGIHLLPLYWHKGYASEALRTVIAYAFNTLNIHIIYAGHHPHNTASKQTLLSVGFESIGERYYQPTGLYHPSYKIEKRET